MSTANPARRAKKGKIIGIHKSGRADLDKKAGIAPRFSNSDDVGPGRVQMLFTNACTWISAAPTADASVR